MNGLCYLEQWPVDYRELKKSLPILLIIRLFSRETNQ
jgi:hypothetical protein